MRSIRTTTLSPSSIFSRISPRTTWLYFSLFFPSSVKVVLSTPSELICELFRLTFRFAHEIILNSRWVNKNICVEEHIYCDMRCVLTTMMTECRRSCFIGLIGIYTLVENSKALLAFTVFYLDPVDKCMQINWTVLLSLIWLIYYLFICLLLLLVLIAWAVE